MHVPLLDLQAQDEPLRDELLAAITRVCDSQRFILGPEVEALEREMASHLGVRDAIAVSSGTDALLVAMMALGIGPGDEVITSTFSFFATAGCIARLGATPRLVDIDPVTFNLSPDAVASAVTTAHAGDRAGAPVRPLCGHGSAAGHRGPCRHSHHRGCVPVDWRHRQGSPGRVDGNRRLLLFLPDQEPGGVRGRRAGDDERRAHWPAASGC